MAIESEGFMTVKPISPKEIGSVKSKIFPPEVLEAVNELIAENYTNGRAEVDQKDLVERILLKMNGNVPSEMRIVKRREVFDKGWLNIEEIYREQGWQVSYDKPGYNEDYEAYFVFKG